MFRGPSTDQPYYYRWVFPFLSFCDKGAYIYEFNDEFDDNIIELIAEKNYTENEGIEIDDRIIEVSYHLFFNRLPSRPISTSRDCIPVSVLDEKTAILYDEPSISPLSHESDLSSQ